MIVKVLFFVTWIFTWHHPKFSTSQYFIYLSVLNKLLDKNNQHQYKRTVLFPLSSTLIQA